MLDGDVRSCYTTGGRPVQTEELRYGLRISVVGMACILDIGLVPGSCKGSIINLNSNCTDPPLTLLSRHNRRMLIAPAGHPIAEEVILEWKN